jgi:hypothetical protein
VCYSVKSCFLSPLGTTKQGMEGTWGRPKPAAMWLHGNGCIEKERWAWSQRKSHLQQDRGMQAGCFSVVAHRGHL